MIVEWLRIQVAPEQREAYVQKDYEIWTNFLRQQPGFLRKDVWISTDNLSEVVLSIHWATLEQQQAIPKPDLEEVKQRFKAALSSPSEVLEIKLYQLRKSTVVS
jgi:uncharacterized protein (TIGR03792 family)